MTKPRDYAAEAKWQATPEQKKNRAQRNAARAAMVKVHGAAALKGKDVDHRHPIRSGGGNAASNLRIRSVSANRSDNGK